MSIMVKFLSCFPVFKFLECRLWINEFWFQEFGTSRKQSLVLWPMSLCAGDPKVSEIGVFQYSSRAKYGFFLSRIAFLIKFLTVWMAFSAMPLDCG